MKFTILKIDYSWLDKLMGNLPFVVVKMETGEIFEFALDPYIKLYDPNLSDIIIERVTEEYKDWILYKKVLEQTEKFKRQAPKPSFWKGKVFNTKEESL
jgi:hypothetical protein